MLYVSSNSVLRSSVCTAGLVVTRSVWFQSEMFLYSLIAVLKSPHCVLNDVHLMQFLSLLIHSCVFFLFIILLTKGKKLALFNLFFISYIIIIIIKHL